MPPPWESKTQRARVTERVGNRLRQEEELTAFSELESTPGRTDSQALNCHVKPQALVGPLALFFSLPMLCVPHL